MAQGVHGTILTWMQEQHVQALLLLGPPGAGKSLTAKAAGNEAQIPTVMLDLRAMLDSHVGASERNVRSGLRVLNAISNGQLLVIATSNDMSRLSPELRRRFRMGTWFCDLPDAEERESIWRVHLRKYPDVAHYARPEDTQWTGAEIGQCVELAWNLDISLHDAAQYVVPVAVSAREQIATLRSEAAGRYLSASQAGLYRVPTDTPTEPRQSRRFARA